MFGSWANFVHSLVILSSQKSEKLNFQHLGIFLSSSRFPVSQAWLWHDITAFWLQIRIWSFHKSWRWYIGLQFWFILFALILHGFGVWASPIRAVRLPSRWLNRSYSALPVSELGRRVAPHIAGVLIAQATSSCSTAFHAPHSPLPPAISFSFLPSPSPPRSPAASNTAAATVPPSPLPTGAHHVPPPSPP